HTSRSHAGAPTWRAMSAETMKMPEPIIEPATTAVASHRPSPRTSSSEPSATEAAAGAGRALEAMLPSSAATTAGGRGGVIGRQRQQAAVTHTVRGVDDEADGEPAHQARPVHPPERNHQAQVEPDTEDRDHRDKRTPERTALVGVGVAHDPDGGAHDDEGQQSANIDQHRQV